MISNNTISIIIPAYNAEKTIDRALNSVIRQTYSDLEIIVVNDGSSDRTEEIVNDFIKQDSRVRLITKKNGGVSSARNQGLSKATGEFILFVDSDDYIEQIMCEEMISHVGDYDISICGWFYDDDSRRVCRPFAEERRISSDEIVFSMLERDGISTALWNKMYRRSVIFNKDIRFDPKITNGEDMLFICKYVSQIDGGIYFPKPLYHYSVVDQSLSHNLSFVTTFNLNRLTERLAYSEIERMYADNLKICKQIKRNLANFYCYMTQSAYLCKDPDSKMQASFRFKMVKYLPYSIADKKLSVKGKVSYILTLLIPKVMRARKLRREK